MKKIKTRKNKSSNTNFKGVHLHTRKQKYEAIFTYGTEKYFIGTFPTLAEAVTARREYIFNLI